MQPSLGPSCNAAAAAAILAEKGYAAATLKAVGERAGIPTARPGLHSNAGPEHGTRQPKYPAGNIGVSHYHFKFEVRWKSALRCCSAAMRTRNAQRARDPTTMGGSNT